MQGVLNQYNSLLYRDIRECGSTLYVGLARAVSPNKLPVNVFTNPTSGGSP